MVNYTRKAANFSLCGKYRYTLERSWSRDLFTNDGRHCTFGLLNPSDAGESNDDPTTIRCVNFAAYWKFSKMTICNMLPFVATDPKDLKKWLEGDSKEVEYFLYENRDWLYKTFVETDLIVCGWGSNKIPQLAKRMFGNALGKAGMTTMCLKINKDGNPAHPLYLPRDLEPIPFPNNFRRLK